MNVQRLLRRSGLAIASTVLMVSLVAAPVPHGTALACQSHPAAAAIAPDEPVPFYEGLRAAHYPITTRSDTAQQYFNQGLLLAYGFNHAEAARSFRAAIAADDTCALCHWGLAYVLGPNINAPMEPNAVSPAWRAIQQAIARSDRATPKERALIQATAERYAADPHRDRGPLDVAYARALGQVHRQYPDDLDIATLYAEALMDTMPWDYWDAAGNPKPETEEILTVLDTVLEKDPWHIGALHLYIHAVEKERPELAEAAADRLRDLAPNVGHLIHMPGHIYIRIGRYYDAVVANQAALTADYAYMAGNHTPSLYTDSYVLHNAHFLWYAALMTGQSELARQAAAETAQVDPDLMRDPALAASLQHYAAVPLFTQVRFAQWDAVQQTPAPASDLRYLTGIWHYAQGMAAVGTGQLAQAEPHLTALERLIADPAIAELRIWGFNGADQVLGIAANVLAGELAAARGNTNAAVGYLEAAVAIEDQLTYTEPPDWYSPTRHLLGEILLRANRPAEAEAAFRDDLATYPENGWSLHGLAQSLRAQGRTAEADTIQARFEAAWAHADFTLATRP